MLRVYFRYTDEVLIGSILETDLTNLRRKDIRSIPVLRQQISDASPTKFWFLVHHLPIGCEFSVAHLTIHLTILQPKGKNRNDCKKEKTLKPAWPTHAEKVCSLNLNFLYVLEQDL